MFAVKETEAFAAWKASPRDKVIRSRVLSRLSRVETGNFGDCGPVGSDVSEMCIHFGPGYRVYFVIKGHQVVFLLCGGDKSTQDADIKTAKKLAKEI